MVKCQRWTGYQCEAGTVSDDMALTMLNGFADGYLRQRMLAGQILQQDIDFCRREGVFSLVGVYSCLEMIGREQSEETLGNYGKTD